MAVAIAFVAACATMQSRWEATKSADTAVAYDEFLKEYPEGDFADRARVRRNELHGETDWKDAEAKNTVAAYEEFRKNYPQGKHKNDVYARLAVLSLPKVSDLPFVSTELFLQRYQRGAPLKNMETEILSVDVKNITFKIAGDGKELLFVEFDRFYTPAISGIEDKEPRIILEIKNVSSLRKDWGVRYLCHELP